VALADQDAIPMIYVLITLCREFMVSGLRMMAAAKGVVVAADKGGKTKTITQLIAIGFLLAKPMVERDWSHVLPSWDFGWLVDVTHQIGLVGFILGTFFAVWSGYRYFRLHKDIVFADANL